MLSDKYSINYLMMDSLIKLRYQVYKKHKYLRPGIKFWRSIHVYISVSENRLAVLFFKVDGNKKISIPEILYRRKNPIQTNLWEDRLDPKDKELIIPKKNFSNYIFPRISGELVRKLIKENLED